MSLYVIQFMKFRALRTPLTSRLTLAPCYLNYLFIFITCNNLQYSTRRLIECRMISFSRSRLFGSMWIGSLRSAQLCTLAICWSRLIFSFFLLLVSLSTTYEYLANKLTKMQQQSSIYMNHNNKKINTRVFIISCWTLLVAGRRKKAKQKNVYPFICPPKRICCTVIAITTTVTLKRTTVAMSLISSWHYLCYWHKNFARLSICPPRHTASRTAGQPTRRTNGLTDAGAANLSSNKTN